MIRFWPGNPDREEWPAFLLFMGVTVVAYAGYWAWTAATDGSIFRALIAVLWVILGAHFLVRWNRARRHAAKDNRGGA